MWARNCRRVGKVDPHLSQVNGPLRFSTLTVNIKWKSLVTSQMPFVQKLTSVLYKLIRRLPVAIFFKTSVKLSNMRSKRIATWKLCSTLDADVWTVKQMPCISIILLVLLQMSCQSLLSWELVRTDFAWHLCLLVVDLFMCSKGIFWSKFFSTVTFEDLLNVMHS